MNCIIFCNIAAMQLKYYLYNIYINTLKNFQAENFNEKNLPS